MSDDRDVLPFPSAYDGLDPELAERIAAMYAATPDAGPDAVAQCLRVVLSSTMHAPSRITLGVLRPRWWWGAAAAVLVVAATVSTWRSRSHDAPTDSTGVAVTPFGPGDSTPSSQLTRVSGSADMRFDLRLSARARAVAIVGDFNGWDERATPMTHRGKDGSWSAQVALAPGRHVYAFVVDGKRWLVDPLAPQVPDSGFGPTNAVVIEAAPQ